MEHIKYVAPIAGMVAAAGIVLGACGGNTPVHDHAAGKPSPPAAARPSRPASPSPPSGQSQGSQPVQSQGNAPEPSPPPSPPAELVTNGYSGTMPSTLYIGAQNEIDNITWSQWNSMQAVGTGQQLVPSCNPDCVSGPVSYESVKVTLSDPQGGQFTQINEVDASTGAPVNAQYGPSISTFLQGAS